MMSFSKSLAVGVIALATIGLAACSSSDSSAPAASPTSSMVGGDPGTWTPVMISPDSIPDTAVDVVVGQAINFNFPLKNDAGETLVLQSGDPSIVEVTSQADEAGTVTFGAKAVGVGTTDLTLGVEGAASPTAAIIVNVTE